MQTFIIILAQVSIRYSYLEIVKMVWIYLCAVVVVLIAWQLSRVVKETNRVPECRFPGSSDVPSSDNPKQLDDNIMHFIMTEMARTAPWTNLLDEDAY